MNNKIISYEELEKADLHIDAIYKGGPQKNISAEPLHILFPKCGTSSGFRKVKRADGSGKMAYVVLYTSLAELEWPDYLDRETGIFRYYGDNRNPGRELTDTKQGGNRLLETVFDILNTRGPYDDIPPFFLFSKAGTGHDMQFLGLAAPGNRNLSSDRDLVAFWRTMNGSRFQNYESYFTILDTEGKAIPRQWLHDLIFDHENSLKNAPDAWKRFIQKGRDGIAPLKAPTVKTIPTPYAQVQSDAEGMTCLDLIRDHYKNFPQGFEACAIDIIAKMDRNFVDFSLTRPWRDGGRDAVGKYMIRQPGVVNHPLEIECALEAKCYSKKGAVGVKEMSRLISRIRYRQFGIMLTTGYVHKQAYEEVIEDGHPILIITASDIAAILRQNAIHSNDVMYWLSDIDERNGVLKTYGKLLSKALTKA